MTDEYQILIDTRCSVRVQDNQNNEKQNHNPSESEEQPHICDQRIISDSSIGVLSSDSERVDNIVDLGSESDNQEMQMSDLASLSDFGDNSVMRNVDLDSESDFRNNPLLQIDHPDSESDVLQTEHPDSESALQQTEHPDSESDLLQTEHPTSESDLMQTKHPDSDSDLQQTEHPDSQSDLLQTENPDSQSDFLQTEHPDSQSDELENLGDLDLESDLGDNPVLQLDHLGSVSAQETTQKSRLVTLTWIKDNPKLLMRDLHSNFKLGAGQTNL